MSVKTGDRLQVWSDGHGRFSVEFPLQVEGRTARVVAAAVKVDEHPEPVSTVVVEEGIGSGAEFRAEKEWTITGMRAVTNLITALHAVVYHAFGWRSPGPEHTRDN